MHAPAKPANRFLHAVAALFGAAAVFHFWRIVSPDPTDPSGSARHAVFVAINLLIGTCLWFRPALLRVVFGLLVVQQVASHGGHAWNAWFEQHQIDVLSLVIVVLLPTTWAVLWRIRS